MELNDILEENSIQAISQKTKIPEDNLEILFDNKFENLRKVKTLGFISILEREYGADLNALRAAAKNYYDAFGEESGITIATPFTIEKKGKSKILFIAVFLLLGYATWFFLTQFDQKNFSGLLEFIDRNDSISTEIAAEELSIAAVAIAETKVEDNTTEENESLSENKVDNNTTHKVEPQ